MPDFDYRQKAWSAGLIVLFFVALKETAVADKLKAQTEAERSGVDLADSREELKKKNEKLEVALAEASAARDRAQHATSVAEQKSDEALQAKAQLQRALADKTARVEELEAERKKLVTKLKE